jgi:hypothetical protein
MAFACRTTDWVNKQPLVDPNGLGIIAGSKGTEAGLLPATTNHKIKAVAAIAPSAYVFWEIRGPGGYADFDKFTVDEVYPKGFMRPILLVRRLCCQLLVEIPS